MRPSSQRPPQRRQVSRPCHRGGWLLLLLALLACRQDMHDQAKYEPYEATALFADGASARSPAEGTVARGQLREDRHLYAGMSPQGTLVTSFPFPVTRDVLDRGQGRYDAFCSPCHDRAGTGRGMIVRRGFKQPASFHEERLQRVPVGYFFDVITHGFGQMSSYAHLVPPRDRWAIIAYIRALQLAQDSHLAELPDPLKERARAALAAGSPGSSGAEEGR